MRTITRSSLLLSVCVFACPTARSQTPIYAFDGLEGQKFGISVSGAGDVNGDGFDDMIVGALFDRVARALSGVDGSVLYTLAPTGNWASDQFGYSVSGAGDVNGDGFDDLIVGARFGATNGPHSGSAYVFSGLDGSQLYTFHGDSPHDRFGQSVSDAGDLNGDGFDDLVVGAWWDDNNGVDSGSARAFSGVDGSVLYTLDGDSPTDWFGLAVSGAGDVNGDGFDDLIVGADQDWTQLPGYARVFSGVDGSILYTFDGDSPHDQFGHSVSGAGDVNGDGYDDLIVGANQDHELRRGYSRVFSGIDGSVLHTFDGDTDGEQFGCSVSGAGDVNGDGFDDVIVGARYDDDNGWASGSAHVFSGVNGGLLYDLHGDSSSDTFGWSVSGAGDVTGDGFDDMIIGAPGDDNNGPNSGSALVFSPCGSWHTTQCSPAVRNSSGEPGKVQACGSDAIAANSLTLMALQLPPNEWGYFLNSEVQGFVFPVPNSQGALCLGGGIGRYVGSVFNSGATGSGSLLLDLANTPTPAGTVAIQPGETWYFQCWYRDSNPGPTSNFTDAISVTFE